MFKWYLITHNLNSFKPTEANLNALDVETYIPVKVKLTKRADWSGVRTSTVPLFPGYIFIKLDPEKVHPSVISKVIGVKEFVRFGGQICTVSAALIEGMRQSFLLRTDKNVTQLEYHNLPASVIAMLEFISLIKCKNARQTAFFELLQNNMSKLMDGSSGSRVTSVIERPFVNDLIN